MLRIFLILFFYLLSFPSQGSYAYQYDAEQLAVYCGNIEFEKENKYYDVAPNLCYRCINHSAENLREKALDGSFFAFEVGLVATKGGSILSQSSSAAFRAADDIGDFVPKNKHLLGGGSQSKARFNTSDVGEVRSLIQEALRSPNAQFLPNPNIPGTFRVVTDLGRQVGVKGQTSLRTIVGQDGKVINSFPVHSR